MEKIAVINESKTLYVVDGKSCVTITPKDPALLSSQKQDAGGAERLSPLVKTLKICLYDQNDGNTCKTSTNPVRSKTLS